jgi:hypothetical protein
VIINFLSWASQMFSIMSSVSSIRDLSNSSLPGDSGLPVSIGVNHFARKYKLQLFWKLYWELLSTHTHSESYLLCPQIVMLPLHPLIHLSLFLAVLGIPVVGDFVFASKISKNK